MALTPIASRRPLIAAVLVLVAIAALVWFLRGRIHFEWRAVAHQLRLVSIGYVASGVAVIYACYWLRSMRWAVLMSPLRRTRASEVLAAQLVGFTALVLFGRLADLVRPYLVSRRLGVSVASQLAVYSVERACDLGAAAVLFSLTLAVTPRDLPHHAAYVRAGALSLAATVFIAAFAVSLRFAGEKVAALFRRLIQPVSTKLAETLEARVLDFRDGLRTVTSLREFLVVAVLSIAMWGGIAISYTLAARSFVHDPVLAHFSFTATMLLLATSIGGSLLQLPVLGWFTQIALVGAALVGFFGVPVETATACAAMIFFVLNLDVIPLGLMAARLGGITLRDAVSQSSVAKVPPSA